MSLPEDAYKAAADWQNAEDNSGDVDTALNALGRLVSSLSGQDAEFRTISHQAGILIALYCNHGGDPNGESSIAMTELLHRANLL